MRLSGFNNDKISASSDFYKERNYIFFLSLFLALTSFFLFSYKVCAVEYDFSKAAEYNQIHRGISFIIMKDGNIIFEDYPNGGNRNRGHELASGTKSFSGVVAIAAVQDGILDLEEKVSDTIYEWREDIDKIDITVRQLLSLISGLDSQRAAGDVPSYSEAIYIELINKPGEKFIYDSAPFQVFGELMKRKLNGENMLDYLSRRIFEPMQINPTDWRRDKNNEPHIPSGAQLTARDWAKFGQLIIDNGYYQGQQIIDSDLIPVLYQSTELNPNYGFTFWLNNEVSLNYVLTRPQASRYFFHMWNEDIIPKDLIFAAGAGNQRLYIIPSKNIVIVRQARGILAALVGIRSNFSDVDFLKIILNALS